MNTLIIKKDETKFASGYSVSLNGVEIPNKKKVEIIKKEGLLTEIVITVVEHKTPHSEVIIIN